MTKIAPNIASVRAFPAIHAVQEYNDCHQATEYL